MATLGVFAKRIRARGVSIEGNANASVKELATDITQTVVLGTPVDLGGARANWDVSLSQPDFESDPEARDKSGAATIARARAVIALRKDESDIWVQNNLPYIGKLNDGHSAQAPKNFVRKAITVATSAFRARRLIK